MGSSRQIKSKSFAKIDKVENGGYPSVRPILMIESILVTYSTNPKILQAPGVQAKIMHPFNEGALPASVHPARGQVSILLHL
jgi:hypothetical protein